MIFLDTFHTSVDLGTTNLLIGIKGEGIVFNEPFVLAIERDSGRIAAIGKEAELVAEKTPKSLTVTSPMRRGVIADYSLAEAFLKQSFRKCVRGRALRRPSVAVGIPTSAKDIDRQALYQVLENAGAGTITCCHESIAAAVGLGLPIWEPRGVALCDVGGGVSEISVLCLGGVITTILLPLAGVDFNAAIRKYLQAVYNLNIGNRTAEYLKIQSSSSGAGENDSMVTVSGVNRPTGLPQRLQVSPREVHQVMTPLFTQISDGIKKALRQVSPELMADIVESGIVVSGGGALLSGLRHLIEREVGIAVTAAEEPLTCLAVGLMSALDDGRSNRARRHDLDYGFPG